MGGSAGDYIRRVAREQVQIEVNKLMAQTSGASDSPWFVGKVSPDKTTILHPNGQTYNLTFTGQIQEYTLACRVTPNTAHAVGQPPLRQSIIDGGKTPWIIIAAYPTGTPSNQNNSPASKPEFNLVNLKTLKRYRIPKESLGVLYQDNPHFDGANPVNYVHNGRWQVQLSPSGNHLAIARYHSRFHNVPVGEGILFWELRVYWATVQNFKLDNDRELVDVSNAIVLSGAFDMDFNGPSPGQGPDDPEFRQLLAPRAVISFDKENTNKPIIDFLCSSKGSSIFNPGPFEFQVDEGAIAVIERVETGSTSATYYTHPKVGNQGITQLMELAPDSLTSFFRSGFRIPRVLATGTSTNGVAAFRNNKNLNTAHMAWRGGDGSPGSSLTRFMTPYGILKGSSDIPFANITPETALGVMDDFDRYVVTPDTGWTSTSNVKALDTKKWSHLVTDNVVDPELGSGKRYTFKEWTYSTDPDNLGFREGKNVRTRFVPNSLALLTQNETEITNWTLIDWVIK